MLIWLRIIKGIITINDPSRNHLWWPQTFTWTKYITGKPLKLHFVPLLPSLLNPSELTSSTETSVQFDQFASTRAPNILTHSSSTHYLPTIHATLYQWLSCSNSSHLSTLDCICPAMPHPIPALLVPAPFSSFPPSTLLCLNTPTSLSQRLNFLSSLPPILPFSSLHGCRLSDDKTLWVLDYGSLHPIILLFCLFPS